MSSISCANCGKEVRVASRGPRPKYCGDACRQAAHRGAPGQPAAEAVLAVSVPAPVTSGPLGRFSPGLGDGDWCPQSAEHGRLYFVDQAQTRQWCCHSGHRGGAFYARDGITPVEPAGVAA